jgi:hypothetical protein
LIETIVEIYQIASNEPTLGANVNLRKIPAEFDPKNISNFHRADDFEREDQVPSNLDFNFCCWYVIDKKNHNLNFAILLNEM